MARTEPRSAGRTAQAVAQRLKSLGRAGVTHAGKPTNRAAAAAATPLPAPVTEVARTVSEPLPAAPGDDRAAALAQLARRVSVCLRCSELARTRTQTVFGNGNPHARLVFMGEAPGADEDRQGKPFVGRAGQKLTDIIEKGMKLPRKDVYILNTLKCRPPGNRTPLPDEVANCREYLDGQLAILQPQFICCLGAVAAQSLLDTTVSIGKLRGRLHDFHGIKVLCTYHPAYLLRNPDAKRFVWDDIRLLMAEMGKK
jgi:uracil-DNA glycosylase